MQAVKDTMKGIFIMKTIKIQEVIKEKRLERNLSQEALAEAFDISVQAVSKWENALSYPDITVLPKICDYFNISMDALFFGEKCGLTLTELPDDGMYRVVQCVGKRVIGADEWDEEKKIPLLIPDDPKAKINMEIWGSADIEGDIDGSVKAGKVINCGGVDGSVEAGGVVNCGGVDGSVEAGGTVNCGGVDGSVNAGASINCGGVDGDVNAGNNVSCGDIKGNATADTIKCKKIGGDVNCNKVIIKGKDHKKYHKEDIDDYDDNEDYDEE